MTPLFLLLMAQAPQPEVSLQQRIDAAEAGSTLQLPSGKIQGPLRIQGAQDLRIVAQPDTVLHCPAEDGAVCLLVQDSRGVRIEGLSIRGETRRQALRVADSQGVVLEGVHLRHGRLRIDNAEARISGSTFSDMDAPMVDTRHGGATLEITASYLMGVSFYPHRAPEWLHLHHNNVAYSHGLHSPNSHHNLIQGWPAPSPQVDRNLTLQDPGFVDPDRGDLRLSTRSPALPGFGVPEARVSVDPVLDHQTLSLSVLGWSRSGKVLVHSSPVDMGHGFCAAELALWDTEPLARVASLGCAFDEGAFNAEMAAQAADHYAPVLAQATQAGVRAELGRAARIQTRNTLLEARDGPRSEAGLDLRRSQVWIDRGHQGLDPWWVVEEDYEFGLPIDPSVLTRSPDGARWIWVVGTDLLQAPPPPKAQASCGLEGLVRGEPLAEEQHGLPTFLGPNEGQAVGTYGKLRYAGRVSCQVDGEAPWVQVLDQWDQVAWVHGARLSGKLPTTGPVRHPPADEVTLHPLRAPQPLTQQDIESRAGVVGWSAEGLVLTHAGEAPTLYVTQTTLLDTRTGQPVAELSYTWPEVEPARLYVAAWAREAAFSEVLGLARDKGIRPELGHTQKVGLATRNPPEAVCLNDGSGWRAYTPSAPVEVASDQGPWLSTGPTGAQVLVLDDGQVRTLVPSEVGCPDQPA